MSIHPAWDRSIDFVLSAREDLKELQRQIQETFEIVKIGRRSLCETHKRKVYDFELALESCLEELKCAIGSDSFYTGEDYTLSGTHPDASTWLALTQGDERRAMQ